MSDVLFWTAVVFAAWLVAALPVGLIIGAVIRKRDRQVPD